MSASDALIQVIADQEDRIARLTTEVAALREAGRAAIICLEDWMKTTGHGEVFRRDRDARDALLRALGEEKKE